MASRRTGRSVLNTTTCSWAMPTIVLDRIRASCCFYEQPDQPGRGYGHRAHELPLRRLRGADRGPLLISDLSGELEPRHRVPGLFRAQIFARHLTPRPCTARSHQVCGSHHQMLLPNQPNCGCRATNSERGITCRFTILRCRCGFSSRLPGADVSSRFASDGCINANASRSLSFRATSVTVAGPGTRVLHDRSLCRNDRRQGGIENDALRPFPIGMNADNGRLGLRCLHDRRFG